MTEKARSDESLVEAVKRGDRGAFGALMERHKAGIVSYLYRRLSDRDWAEDLAQEVFLRVYRKVGDFKSDARFSTWLYRIAHNLSIDFLKRKRLEPRLGIGGGGSDSEPGMEVESPSPDPEQDAMRRELGAKVLEAVHGLGAKYRDVFVLCAMQGLDYEGAAQVLGLSVKTVSSRLCRARKKFKAKMTPWVDTVIA